MKAILLDRFISAYDELEISEVPDPEAGEGEVIVQIVAAGVNFVDLLYAKGKHQNNSSLVTPPFILGLEFSGIIVDAPSSSEYSKGDRVFGGGLGAYAEKIAVPESSLHRIPPSWDFVAAAGLAATAPVSYGALMIRCGLKKGETVLVHAAAGALGLMAVQIAKNAGARVIALASSTHKIQMAKSFGADECVDYRNLEWWKEILNLTDGDGVEVVFDTVGLVDKSLKCLKHQGRILVVGFAGTEGQIERIAMNKVLLKQALIIGYRYGETGRRNPSETTAVWNALEEMINNGTLKPTVYPQRYSGLESVPLALNDLKLRKVWGKAVVLMNSGSALARL